MDSETMQRIAEAQIAEYQITGDKEFDKWQEIKNWFFCRGLTIWQIGDTVKVADREDNMILIRKGNKTTHTQATGNFFKVASEKEGALRD